jgi:hypothetical protein
MGEDLAQFLRGLFLEVAASGERTLEARFEEPIPVDDEAARLELDLYLRVWEAMNSGAWAARVSSYAAASRTNGITQSAGGGVWRMPVLGLAAPYPGAGFVM